MACVTAAIRHPPSAIRHPPSPSPSCESRVKNDASRLKLAGCAAFCLTPFFADDLLSLAPSKTISLDTRPQCLFHSVTGSSRSMNLLQSHRARVVYRLPLNSASAFVCATLPERRRAAETSSACTASSLIRLQQRARPSRAELTTAGMDSGRCNFKLQVLSVSSYGTSYLLCMIANRATTTSDSCQNKHLIIALTCMHGHSSGSPAIQAEDRGQRYHKPKHLAAHNDFDDRMVGNDGGLTSRASTKLLSVSPVRSAEPATLDARGISVSSRRRAVCPRPAPKSPVSTVDSKRDCSDPDPCGLASPSEQAVGDGGLTTPPRTWERQTYYSFRAAPAEMTISIFAKAVGVGNLAARLAEPRLSSSYQRDHRRGLDLAWPSRSSLEQPKCRIITQLREAGIVNPAVCRESHYLATSSPALHGMRRCLMATERQHGHIAIDDGVWSYGIATSIATSVANAQLILGAVLMRLWLYLHPALYRSRANGCKKDSPWLKQLSRPQTRSAANVAAVGGRLFGQTAFVRRHGTGEPLMFIRHMGSRPSGFNAHLATEPQQLASRQSGTDTAAVRKPGRRKKEEIDKRAPHRMRSRSLPGAARCRIQGSGRPRPRRRRDPAMPLALPSTFIDKNIRAFNVELAAWRHHDDLASDKSSIIERPSLNNEHFSDRDCDGRTGSHRCLLWKRPLFAAYLGSPASAPVMCLKSSTKVGPSRTDWPIFNNHMESDGMILVWLLGVFR
ncbi:hypothetical protein AC579_3975 [Pseudocercospora musae]|uniref:Uncharacterized protein n=1 Tax=Pseudocercospora musae TaxID=113226 RepID=A0A139I5N3_9PEZI|nr:hypothetical protein AC579_3975 [Pseudocercospora musae]